VELLTGFGLATAAGLNVYIPLLALGLLSRFTDLVTLPHGWARLENGWVMTIVAVLVVSLTKSTVRPAANVATAGMAAPVLRTVEDVASIGLVFLAILIPVLVAVALLALAWLVVRILRRRRRKAATG
jgi:hypothetical protein